MVTRINLRRAPGRGVLLVGIAAGLTLACGQPRSAKIKQATEVSQQERKPDKLVERGIALAQLGDYTRSSQYLAEALDAGAEPREVLPLLMRVYVQSARYRMAIRVGEEYLAKWPKDHQLRFLVATLYSAIDEPEHARRHLTQVLQRDPANAEAHYVLAVLLRRDNDYVGADRHFRQYLKLQPSGSHAEEARDSLLESVP